MSNVVGDSLIRRLRKERGLTIAELANEICSEEHLTRIERGKRAPSRWVFKQLMERLGENPNKYFTDVVTLEDKRVATLKDKLKNLLFEKTGAADETAEALIKTLEQDEAFDTKENRQFLLMSKASLAHHRENYDDMYRYATAALAETKQGFDVEKIDTYFLSCDEIWLVNQIGIALFFTESIEKSTAVLQKLKKIIERGCIDSDEMIHTYVALLYNLSKGLGLLGRHDEAVAVCDEGIVWCTKHRESYYYPLLLLNKTCGLFSLQRTDEGIAHLERVCALLRGFERYSELSAVKSGIKGMFGVEITALSV